MKCSNGAVKTACGIQIDGKHGPGMPKMTWKQLTGIAESGSAWLLTLMIRHTWRFGVRSDMHAASQQLLPGREPTDMDVAPVPAR